MQCSGVRTSLPTHHHGHPAAAAGVPSNGTSIEQQLLPSAAPPTVLQHIDDSSTESVLVRTSRRTSTTLRWTLEVLPCNMLASAHLLAAQKVTMDAMQCAPPCQPTAWWVLRCSTFCVAAQILLVWVPSHPLPFSHNLGNCRAPHTYTWPKVTGLDMPKCTSCQAQEQKSRTLIV
jgi:hypothetical protein